MPLVFTKSRSGRWLQRLAASAALLLLTGFFLLILVLFFLPTVVATKGCQDLIRKQVSGAIGRPVDIHKVSWSWSKGLTLDRLILPDLPEFSQKPMLSIEKVQFAPDFKRLLRKEVAFAAKSSTVNINIVTQANGNTNIEKLGVQAETLPDSPDSGETTKSNQTDRPLALPSYVKDIAFRLDLENINLRYEDHARGELYEVEQLGLMVETRSLLEESLDFNLEAGLRINGQSMPRSAVSASFNHLFTQEGVLQIQQTAGVAGVKLPGLTAQLDTDLALSKATAALQLDLAAALKAIGPFIPAAYSGTALKGEIDGNVNAGTDPSSPLGFDLSIQGKGLAVTGKAVNGKTIGPGKVSANVSGTLDLAENVLALTDGDIHLFEKGRFRAKATVKQIQSDHRTVHLALSDIFLDLDEIVSIVRPLLPSMVEMTQSPGGNAFFSMNEFKLEGQPAAGFFDLQIHDLSLQLPETAYAEKTNRSPTLQMVNGHLNIEEATVRIADLFPESCDLVLSLDIDRLTGLHGSDSFSISDLRVNRFHVSARDLLRTENSAFGLSGIFFWDQQLEIAHAEVPKQAAFDGIDHLLKGSIHFSVDTPVRVSVETLGLSGESISIAAKEYGPIQTELDVRSDSFEMSVHRLDPLDFDIRNFKMKANLDKVISATISANALHLPDPSLDLKLDLSADIQSLMDKLPVEAPPGISGKGDLAVALSFRGRKPNQKESKAIEKMALYNNLAFVDQLNLNVRLNNGSLTLPTFAEDSLQIQDIDASPLVSYALEGRTGQGAVYSSVITKGVKTLSHTGPENSMSAQFSIAAEHDYLKRIDIRPSVTLSPTDASASANVSIEGLDRMIGRAKQPSLTDLLTNVGIDAMAVVDVPELGRLHELGLRGVPTMDIKGPLATDIRFRLQPDRFAAGSIFLTTHAMTFRMPELIAIDRLDTDFTFSKWIAIARPGRALLMETAPQLSASVMAMEGPVQPSPVRSPIQRHIRRLNERMNPDPTLSFTQADLQSAPFPLIIEDSVFMLNFQQGLPNLDFFQFHLLGGTLNGSLSMATTPKEKNRGFSVDSSIYFSGIDMAEIFPEAFTETGEVETDLAGLLHANIPVSSRMRTLLENASVTVEFTKIGAQALERLLYAIDPYESNEAIVSQRRLLKTGTPKSFKMDVRDGFLSLSGKVSVRGIDITLPTIRRLNIARIPGLNVFEEDLSGLAPLIDLLRKLSATKMLVNTKTNAISFE